MIKSTLSNPSSGNLSTPSHFSLSDKANLIFDKDGRLISSLYNLKLRLDLAHHSLSLGKFSDDYRLAKSGLRPSTDAFENKILINAFHGGSDMVKPLYLQLSSNSVYRLDASVVSGLNTIQYSTLSPNAVNSTVVPSFDLSNKLFDVVKPFNLAEQER